MNEHSLPPDASMWPKDPFRLLGVARGVSARDLRRAYLHLVRSYKPEHAPLQFRLIREAYETAQQLSPLFGEEHESEDGLISAPEPEPAYEPDFEQLGNRVDSEAHPLVAAPDLWEQACQGEPEAAYRGLTELVDSGRAREEGFLQLYWLLVTIPELDRDRTPGDWIVRGLRGCGRLGSRLRELVRRSAEIDPGAMLVDGWLALFAPGSDVEVILEVAGCRWRAARRLERWNVITSDLEALRAWVVHADNSLWTRLLISAAGNLIWAEGPERYTSFLGALAELKHHDQDTSFELFQVEYAEAVVSGLGKLGMQPEALSRLRRLLSLSWDDEGPEYRQCLRTHLRRLAKQPTASLEYLDEIHHRSPAVVSRMVELLGGHGEGGLHGVGSLAWAEISVAIEDFLAANAWWDYQAFRPQLLAFWLREMISPTVFRLVMRDRPEYVVTGDQHIADVVAADSPLIHVYQACALHQA